MDKVKKVTPRNHQHTGVLRLPTFAWHQRIIA